MNRYADMTVWQLREELTKIESEISYRENAGGIIIWPCKEHGGLWFEGVATSVHVPLKTICPHCKESNG